MFVGVVGQTRYGPLHREIRLAIDDLFLERGDSLSFVGGNEILRPISVQRLPSSAISVVVVILNAVLCQRSRVWKQGDVVIIPKLHKKMLKITQAIILEEVLNAP